MTESEGERVASKNSQLTYPARKAALGCSLAFITTFLASTGIASFDRQKKSPPRTFLISRQVPVRVALCELPTIEGLSAETMAKTPFRNKAALAAFIVRNADDWNRARSLVRPFLSTMFKEVAACYRAKMSMPRASITVEWRLEISPYGVLASDFSATAIEASGDARAIAKKCLGKHTPSAFSVPVVGAPLQLQYSAMYPFPVNVNL